ncbi:glutarate dioxygenase GlaH [Bacillus sp. JJ722]|uniref:glutarate dioxygenase GlaH n=1 Tax=Bacillus sp. JJ722 TaxID=3122973 RepID=UPI002FFF682D
MAVIEKSEMKFVQTTEGYEILPHPQSNRLYHIEISADIVKKFLEIMKEDGVSAQRLEYTPFARQLVTDRLLTLTGYELGNIVREILNDRASGGFTVGMKDVTEDKEEFLFFSTAFSHMAGMPNFDSMTGKYYANFSVKDTDNSDSYLRQAYRLFTLHTDGTFVDEPTDWLLMMKLEERNAVGGESRLLHLDDWNELDKFANDPIGSHKFTYKAPSSKNVGQEVERTTFFKQNNKPCICFIDQFVYPETIEQAKYLSNLSDSMEADEAVIELKLPVGNLVMVNNLFWLHGRAAFEKNTELYRELQRQRGRFIQ